MKTAIAYCRVSTADQAAEGVSLDAQREAAAAWCKANGYSLAAVHVDALSGARADNRPALQKAIDAACRAEAALIVYSLSRLARSVQDTLVIAERLDKAGADLVSLSEKIDTTTAAGKMVFRMLAVLAEFERDLVSERTKAALQHKARLGERVGQVPFGFDLADDGVHLRPNAAEQAVLAEVRKLRAKGYSYRDIAAALTAQGVLTKKGRTTWTHTAVRSVVNRAVAVA